MYGSFAHEYLIKCPRSLSEIEFGKSSFWGVKIQPEPFIIVKGDLHRENQHQDALGVRIVWKASTNDQV